MSGTFPCKVAQLCAVSASSSVLLRYSRHSIGSCMNKRLTTYKVGARSLRASPHCMTTGRLVLREGADKSLARGGKKKATAYNL